MSHFTPDHYATHLLRTFTPAAGERPRLTQDVTDKGETVLEFVLPHPTEARFSITLTASSRRGAVTTCALRFGPAEIAAFLDPAEAVEAMGEIIADNIVAVVRYQNLDAYDDHRVATYGFTTRLYQLPDDTEALAALEEKLQRPATVLDRLRGSLTGVFEFYRWSEHRTLKR